MASGDDAVASSMRSDKEIGQSPLRPAGVTALLLCCFSSPMTYIDSSSRRESEPFRPATNGMLFLGQDTRITITGLLTPVGAAGFSQRRYPTLSPLGYDTLFITRAPRAGAALTGLPQGPSPTPGAYAPGYFLPPPWGSSQLRRSGRD